MNWLTRNITGLRRHDGRKRLVSNVLALSVLQVSYYILPLITVPYLVRVLGAERFGLLAFAAAFNMYFVMLADVGFDLSATRAVALNRERLSVISEIFCSVTIIKTVVLIVGLGILLGMLAIFERFRAESAVFLCSYSVTVGQAYFPSWFFAGMERMKHITILNVISRLTFAVLIFFVVKGPEDYLYVPLLNALGFFIAATIATIIIVTKLKVELSLQPVSALIFRFKESVQFFVSRAAVSVIDNSNAFIIGLLLGNVAVGYYSAAEKLFKAMTALHMPLVNSLYPYMSNTRDIRAFRRIFSLATVGNLLLCLGVILFAYQIIALVYGPDFGPSATLLQLFAVLAGIMAPSALLGYPLLGALGHDGYANYSVIAAAGLHILLIVIAIPVISSELVIIFLIVSQLAALTIKVIGVRRHLSPVLKGEIS